MYLVNHKVLYKFKVLLCMLARDLKSQTFILAKQRNCLLTSGQDGGIDRYTLPSFTTKRKITTNLKTSNNQNCQKIKLYGGLTTKELKKKHSFSPVGGAEKTCGEAVAGEPRRRGGGW